MAQPGASSPEIVRREFLDAGFSRVLPDHVPDDLLAQAASSHSARARHSPKDSPTRDSG
jgi:hypothetical protein